jgi:hypothetical protein
MEAAIATAEVLFGIATGIAYFAAFLLLIYQLWRTRNAGLLSILLGSLLGSAGEYLRILIPKEPSASLSVQPVVLHLVSLAGGALEFSGAVLVAFGIYYLFPVKRAETTKGST